MAHVPACGFVAQALPRSDHPLEELQESGGVAGLSLGVDLLELISGVHLQDHAGGDALALVGLPGASRDCGSGASESGSGVVPLDADTEASLDPLLHGHGGDEFVCVPDAGEGLACVAHLPQLGGAALGMLINLLIFKSLWLSNRPCH